MSFREQLRTQRWDDHRYYHHSRINQSLHFVSALALWAVSPLVLFVDPALFGVFTPWASPADFMRQVAKIWLAIGIGGVLFRTVHLFFIRDVETGLVWMTKILTDPFNDLKLYYKAPLYLMKGELIDPGLGQVQVRKARSN